MNLRSDLRPQLKVAPCSFKSAKFAVTSWHYSKCMPAGKLVKFGVWEAEDFIGAVIFGRGANNNLAASFKMKQTECCELVRVALASGHQSPVTRIVAICLRLLKKLNPGLQLVVSYADETNQGHKGIIYKAGNWKYHGTRTSKGGHFIIGSKLVHNRSISAKFGSRDKIPPAFRDKMQPAPPQVKHLFSYDLRQLSSGSSFSSQEKSSGSIPTLALQQKETVKFKNGNSITFVTDGVKPNEVAL